MRRLLRSSAAVVAVAFGLTVSARGDEPLNFEVSAPPPLKTAIAAPGSGTLPVSAAVATPAPKESLPAADASQKDAAKAVGAAKTTAPGDAGPTNVSSPPAGPVSASGPICVPDTFAPACADWYGASSCDRAPRWAFNASFLYMKRSDPDRQPLLNVPAANTVLDFNQFQFDYEPGFEVAVSRRIGTCWEIEARYLQLHDWDASAGRTFPAGSGNIATNPPTPFFAQGAGANFAFDYNSELHSAELTLWRHLGCRARLGAGFRWLEFNEEMPATTFIGGDVPALDVRQGLDVATRNQLYGFQLAADAVLFRTCRFDLQAFGKAGVYSVNAQSRVQLTSQTAGGGAPVVVTASDSTSDVAFVGEAALLGSFRLTCNIHLYGGYQLLWLDGVATIGDSLGATGNLNLANPTTRTRADNDIFVHGFVGGVRIVW